MSIGDLYVEKAKEFLDNGGVSNSSLDVVHLSGIGGDVKVVKDGAFVEAWVWVPLHVLDPEKVKDVSNRV